MGPRERAQGGELGEGQWRINWRLVWGKDRAYFPGQTWWGRGKGKDWTSSERHRLDCVREGGAVGWTVFPVGENSALLSFLTRLSP